MKNKKILGIMILSMCGMIFPDEALHAKAKNHAEIQEELSNILYDGNGGGVSCDFDGYVNTSGRHEGIDFCKSSGSTVYSLIDGEVINVVNTSGSLSTLAIYDNVHEKTVIYLHTANIIVNVGDSVTQGQPVATESNRGSTAAHTHVEVRDGWRQYAAKSVGDYTLDNDNPYPYWETVLTEGFESKNYSPEGDLENAKGGDRCITVSGWALDRDDMNRKVEVNFYKDEVKAGNELHGGVICDLDRGDGTSTGFSVTFPTDKTGTYKVVAIALNLEGTGGNHTIIGEKTVTVTAKENFGDDFYAQIVDADGKLMAASGSADKPPMLMKMYKPNENQWLSANKTTWHFIRNTKSNYYTIWSFAAGEAMELQDASDAAGTLVQLTGNKKAVNGHQQWYIMRENGGYTIRPVCNDKMALEIANGTNVQLNAASSSSNQLFTIQKLSDDKDSPVVSAITEESKTNDSVKLKITASDTTGVKYMRVNAVSWKKNDTTVYNAVQSDANTWTATINTKDFENRHGQYNITVDAYDYFGHKGSKSMNTKLGVYTLKFDANSGSVSEASRTVVYGYPYSRGAVLPTPTRKGYNFAGWYTAKTGGTKITDETKVTQTADHTIYAQWKPAQYTVTFELNGGKSSETTRKVTYESTYGASAKLPTPTYAGYTFKGWYTSSDFKTQVTDATKVTATANHKLYAKWSANSYKVTLDANGGTLGTASATLSTTTGKAYGTLPTPTYSGYIFKGWFTAKTDGTQVKSGTIFNVGANQTLYAQWTKQIVPTEPDTEPATEPVTEPTTEPVVKTYAFKGNGTKTDPYQIGSAKDLAAMRDMVNALSNQSTYAKAYYVQTADIDLKNEKWVPIGKRMNGSKDGALSSFQGFYDGNYHKITGLNVSETNKFAGLFGSLNRGGIIENLEVQGKVRSSGASVGGILGELCSGNSIVRNCCFIGDVTGEGTSAGGVVGEMWQSGIIENCYHNGTVTNTALNSAAGGVVGRIDTGKTVDDSAYVKNCYHVGKVTANGERMGSVVGWMVEETVKAGKIHITNCIARTNDCTTVSAGAGTQCDVSALSDRMLCNAATMLGDAFVNNPGSNFNSGYPVFKWQAKGDVNADGEISVQDVIALQKWIHALPKATCENSFAADLNSDGVVDVFDLALLKKMLQK